MTSAQTLDDLEIEIEQFIKASQAKAHEVISPGTRHGPTYVVKYLPASRLMGVLQRQVLYAANNERFTWGDAVYVSPVHSPLSSIMYGEVAVVGTCSIDLMTVFDATSGQGIRLYQRWISLHEDLFTLLTTTVHANRANRELRKRFRQKFRIDCVCFTPDEKCVGYSRASDLWLALTLWDSCEAPGWGESDVVKDLRWCGITADAFQKEDMGYISLLHPTLTHDREFALRRQPRLKQALLSAYESQKRVVVIGF
jgi:hypothetical protein